MTFLRGDGSEGVAIKERVVDRIQFAREHGAELDDAVLEGFRWLKSEGLTVALFDEVGLSVLRSLWWDREHAIRNAISREECEPVGVTTPVREYTNLRGQRTRYSLLDRAFGAGGKLLRNFDEAACDELIESVSQKARGQYATVKFFRNVRKGLNGKTVEDVYTDDQLKDMARKARMN